MKSMAEDTNIISKRRPNPFFGPPTLNSAAMQSLELKGCIVSYFKSLLS